MSRLSKALALGTLSILPLQCASWERAAAQDVSTNLRGHWKLTETSGTTAADSSSVPHSGVYTNGVQLAGSTAVPVDGAVAANFDGYNDYVAVSTESYFDITGAITVAAWIKVDAWTTPYQAIVTKGDSAWRLHRYGSSSGVSFDCSNLSTISVGSSVAVNDGKWHHVVGVFTGTQLRIYVDGQLSNSTGAWGSIGLNNFAVEIGRNGQAAGREFDGAIYDVRVYNRALSAADISYLCLQGGPVGHWKFNHASGTTVVDSSLYGSTGVVYNGTAWSTRCNGTRTFDFNGTSQYVSIPSAAHLQPTAALSITGWLRGDSWGAGTEVDVLLRKGEGNPNNYQLAVSDGRLELLLDASDGSGIRGNTVLSTGQWYHVAATWDGSTAKLYVDGKLDASVSRSGSIGVDARDLYIGGRSGADLFDGMLQEIRLYNRALAASEIASLSGLPGHWKFSEGAGASAADSSLSANNATLSGGAAWVSDCLGNNALQTNGAGGVAQTSAAFDPPSEGSVAFWMQTSPSSTTRRILGNGGDWEVRQQADGTIAFDLCGEAGTTFVNTQPLTDNGRWRHLAAVYNSTDESYAVYVDGVLDKAGTHAVNLQKQPAAVLSFGTRTGSTEYWGGALRDFRAYSRQLCPTEIAELAGLYAYWKFDETSGSVASDSSPCSRNGSVIGTATWTTGKVSNALQLNGSTYVTASLGSSPPKNVTIAGWANLTAKGSSGAELISLGDYFAIRLDAGTQTQAFFYNGTGWTAIGATSMALGAGWRHYAAVFNDDQNSFKLYINGIEAASMSTSASIVFTGLGSNIVLGRHGNGQTTTNFTGLIDEVQIFSRALCPEQITELVNDGGGAYQGIKILQWVETR